MNQSPFHSILGTNHVPTERESEMITEFLAEHENQLAELQSRIAEEEAVPQKLRKRYEELRGNIDINAHRALTSPFRRLPDDILREIFLRCLPPNRNPTMCVAEPPLLLAHVCGRWRQVAFSTPRLWSSLHISNYLYEGQILDTKLESRDEGTLQWIGRAGDIPLSLSFPAPQTLSLSRYSTDLRRLLSILSPSFPRWKKVDIFLEGLDSALFEIVALQDEGGQKPFQSVEQLVIRVSLYNTTPVTTEEHMHKASKLLSELGLSSSKRLRKLGLYFDEFTQLHSEPLRLTDIFPCGQLEVLDLQGNLSPHEVSTVPLNFLPSLLQACPQLVVFRANISPHADAASSVASTSRIPLDRLKEVSLFFHGFDDSDALDILARCNWPALTSFYLRKPFPNNEMIRPLSSFIGHDSCALTSLRLSYCSISPQPLIDLMSVLPTLIQLHLEYPSLPELPYRDEEEASNIIARLTPQPDGTPHALPQLRFLKWERNTGFSDMALAQLLHQRSAFPYSPVPLKQVHVHFAREMQEDILPICADLIDAGLDLRLRYPPSFDTSRDSSMGYVQPLDIDYRPFGWD